LDNLKFKKVLFGGYDKIDVYTKLKNINEKYEKLLQEESSNYRKSIKKLEEKINLLEKEKEDIL